MIRNEVEAHLNKRIKAARSSLQKALKDAEEHLFFDGSPLNLPKNKLLSGEEIEELARTRIDAFIARTDALSLVCGEWAEVSQVLDLYFASKAPFAESGKKKSEFPDAFTLLATEAWAEKNDKKVLAIARDMDWKSYCANSSRITYSDDFGSGLEYFNTLQIPKDFVAKLEVALHSNDAEPFLDAIRDELEHTISGITPEQDASSPLYWEPEGAHAWLSEFELIDNSFRIVDEHEDWVSLEVLASITVEG